MSCVRVGENRCDAGNPFIDLALKEEGEERLVWNSNVGYVGTVGGHVWGDVARERGLSTASWWNDLYEYTLVFSTWAYRARD